MSGLLNWIGHMTPVQFIATIVWILVTVTLSLWALVWICDKLECVMKAMAGNNGDGP
jgi:hypothetical protein